MGIGTFGRRATLCLGLAATLAIAGCDRGADGGSAYERAPRQLTQVAHVAPLSRALPADAIAYFRVPSAADWLLEPRRDGLNELKAGAAHQEVSQQILAAVEDNLLSLFDAPEAGLAGSLLAHVRGPIEIALFASGGGIPVPGALVRTRLEGYDRAAFGELLEALTGAAGLAIAAPLDQDGHALINAGLPLFVHFDDTTGVLYLLSGTNANRAQLENYRTGQYEQRPELADYERTIDDTGRHFALWLDIQRWWPMATMATPPEQLAVLQAIGLDQATFLWLGLSSKDGRAAAVLRLDMPASAGLRAVIAPVRAPGAVSVAGDVSWAARLALPTRADLDRLVGWIDGMEPGSRAAFDEFLTAGTEYLGEDPVALLDAYGPDVLLVSDAAGFYTAYGITDREAAERFDRVFIDRGWASTVERSMNGLAITEVRISGTSLIDEEMVAQLPDPFPTLLPRLGGRSFAIEEGNYVIGANVPQILADRVDRDPRPLADWLGGHGVSWDDALVAVLSESENAPRDVYHFYLQVLAFLASVTDVELDLTRFPTAPDLGLPRAGRLGVQLDSTADFLEARFLYDTTPLEALLNTNILTWYVAGIVAAVAIPAYESYRERAAGGGGADSCGFAFDGECDEPDICAPGTDTTDCGNSSSGGPDSCIYANDGECDEPDVCALGTDTTDCGGASGNANGPDSCMFANDGECDEPENCAMGTDTTDCSGGGSGPDSCAFANDGECDEPINCSVGTDTTDCDAFPPGPDSCPWANDGECDEPEACRTGTDTTDCATPAGAT